MLSLTAQAKEIEKLLVELHTSNTKINYLEHVLVEEQEMRERHSLKVQRPSMYEDYQGG